MICLFAIIKLLEMDRQLYSYKNSLPVRGGRKLQDSKSTEPSVDGRSRGISVGEFNLEAPGM